MFTYILCTEFFKEGDRSLWGSWNEPRGKGNLHFKLYTLLLLGVWKCETILTYNIILEVGGPGRGMLTSTDLACHPFHLCGIFRMLGHFSSSCCPRSFAFAPGHMWAVRTVTFGSSFFKKSCSWAFLPIPHMSLCCPQLGAWGPERGYQIL